MLLVLVWTFISFFSKCPLVFTGAVHVIRLAKAVSDAPQSRCFYFEKDPGINGHLVSHYLLFQAKRHFQTDICLNKKHFFLDFSCNSAAERDKNGILHSSLLQSPKFHRGVKSRHQAGIRSRRLFELCLRFISLFRRP